MSQFYSITIGNSSYGKGGVGKTTIAVTLARLYTSFYIILHKVILTDESSGSCTAGFPLQSNQ